MLRTAPQHVPPPQATHRPRVHLPLPGGGCDYLHFADEETEAQRGTSGRGGVWNLVPARSAESGGEPQRNLLSAPRGGAPGRWGSTQSCVGRCTSRVGPRMHTGGPPRARGECRQRDRWGQGGPTAARTASRGGLRPAFSKTLESIHWEYAGKAPTRHSYCGVSGGRSLTMPAVAATLPSVPGSRRNPAFMPVRSHVSPRNPPVYSLHWRLRAEERCVRGHSTVCSLSGQWRGGRAPQAEGTARAKAWRLGSPH